jgi:hypothetical protein
MATSMEHVRPGDLIVAPWMNDLVDAVNDLSTRVAALEAKQADGGAVVITNLIFTSPLRLGDPLEIRGLNFGYSRGAQQVRFDNVDITEFRTGSDDTRLLVTVPSFANFPESGRDVTLFVSNGVSSAIRTLSVLPADRPVSGNLVDVLWETITPNPFLPNDTPRFGYRLRSRVGVSRTFTITPTVSRSELQKGIELREIQGDIEVPLTNRQIHLASLQEKLFCIYLPAIPDGLTKGTSFTITVHAVSGGVTGTDSRDFTVGEKTIQSDPTITLSFSSFSAVDDAGDPLPPADGSYDSASNTIRLRGGNFGRTELQAIFEQVGTYTVKLIPEGTVEGWTRNLDTGKSIQIEQNDLDSHNGKAPRLVKFNLKVTADAPASQIEVRIERDGATTGERLTFNLARITN